MAERLRTVVEFGIKGSRVVENQIMPSLRSGKEMAYRLAYVFGGTPTWVHLRNQCSRKNPRVVWESSTHFVALSVLDGVDRGPAAAQYWRK